MKKLFFFLFLATTALVQSDEKVDLSVVHRIKIEAFQNGKVMDHMFYLTDVNGPRLSGSPGFKSAADWAVKRLKEWGIANTGLESWGKFGRSWSLRRFEAHLLQPSYTPILGYPLAWSQGTSGKVKAEVAYAPFFFWWEDDLRRDPSKVIERAKQYAQQQRGKLRGKIVMIESRREIPLTTEPPSERYK
jgi:carboxypeptidase Q